MTSQAPLLKVQKYRSPPPAAGRLPGKGVWSQGSKEADSRFGPRCLDSRLRPHLHWMWWRRDSSVRTSPGRAVQSSSVLGSAGSFSARNDGAPFPARLRRPCNESAPGTSGRPFRPQPSCGAGEAERLCPRAAGSSPIALCRGERVKCYNQGAAAPPAHSGI